MARLLHQIPLEGDEWWGCDFPERPYEPHNTSYDPDCQACFLHAQAAVATGNGSARSWEYYFTGDLSEWVETIKERHDVR